MHQAKTRLKLSQRLQQPGEYLSRRPVGPISGAFSEQQPCRKLKLARGAEISRGESRTAGDDAECCGAYRRYGIPEVSLIERIKRIGPDLEGDPLLDFRILGEREIQI
jgi:hypothetical protein